MNAQDHKQALPPGSRLGSYRVVRVLGAGGFGVTYLCEHRGLGVPVAVKEYMPNDIAVRSGNAVAPKSTADREGYQWGFSRFLDEARTLARFEHRNVVRVRDFFEANGTAYIVMDYEDGEPLDRVLERTGRLTEAQIKRLLLPIVAGLGQMHAAGFLHRDVKPANIFIRRSDESPVLLDFGSARQALGRLSRTLTAIASSGYSPPEQYESNGEQGPWTDIYALSALCYRAVTGMAPVEATRRQSRLLRGEDDPLPRLAEIARARCSQAFLAAVDRGLCVVEGERQGSLDEWWSELEGPLSSQGTGASVAAERSQQQGSGRAEVTMYEPSKERGSGPVDLHAITLPLYRAKRWIKIRGCSAMLSGIFVALGTVSWWRSGLQFVEDPQNRPILLGLTVVVLPIAAYCFWIGTLLWQAGRQIGTAISQGRSSSLSAALQKLRRFFVISSIARLLYLVLVLAYVLILVTFVVISW